MENIRKADSSTPVPPTTLQGTDDSRLLSDRQQMIVTLFSSTPSPGVDIEQERNMMKACADLALFHVREMDAILDFIEIALEPSESLFSPAAALWTSVCSISATTIPFQPVAQFAAAGAFFAASELLEPPLWYCFNKYNVACLRQETRNLMRALEEGNISEKKGYLDSWHLRVRSWLSAL
ncbi:hypothetical protein NW754_009374 [Fusarium falciforme]|nr:hypothetical protein NW754_009374 [Fusarium falciforme]KAJ4260804.1 hypothetical protein NW757_001187 [Fusarium falciforme]